MCAILGHGSLEPPLVTLLSLGCKLLIPYPKWDHQFPKGQGGPAIALSFCILSLLVSALSALWAPGRQAGFRSRLPLGWALRLSLGEGEGYLLSLPLSCSPSS